MKIRLIFLIFSLCAAFHLSAELRDYFKPCSDKSPIHKMRNIDFIYMINLDQRPEKFASCIKQLHPYGIYPYRFSAVNGWELPLEVINHLGVKYRSWMDHSMWGTCYLPENNGQPLHEVVNMVGRNYYCHCMTRGAIGIVLSHLSILQDAYDSGYDTIWVMEDDIEVIQNPHRLSNLIKKLDKAVGYDKWDILFTDRDTKNNKGEYVMCQSYAKRPNFAPLNVDRFIARHTVGSRFIKVGARYGAYSMIVRRSGIKKILNFIKTYQIFLPYDMDYYLPNDIRMYSLVDDVISTQPIAPSDNGGANYKKNES
jgi:GR25 family glycosyltransferase involved in LPS biosynthesis